jgi:hypothetical protein
MLQTLLRRTRLFTSWIVSFSYHIVALLHYNLTNDAEVIAEAHTVLSMADQFAFLLPRPLTWIYDHLHLDLLVLQFERGTESLPPHVLEACEAEPVAVQGSSISSPSSAALRTMGECLARTLDLARNMSTCTEMHIHVSGHSRAGDVGSVRPMRADPFMPLAAVAHEWSLRVLGSVCVVLLCVPEAYFVARKERRPTPVEFTQELVACLLALRTSFYNLLQVVQRMGCGFCSGYSYYCLYKVHRVCLQRTGMLEGVAGELLNGVLTLTRQLLETLATHFGLAKELLQRIDDLAQSAENEKQAVEASTTSEVDDHTPLGHKCARWSAMGLRL